MPIPLIGAVLGAIAPELAKHGLDLLSGIFRGSVEKGADKVADLIREKTGIEVHEIAENKLTDEQWIKLREFEQANQENLLKVRQEMDLHELEMLRVEDSKGAREAQTKRDNIDDPLVRRFTYIYAYLITGLSFLFIFFAILAPALVNLPAQSWRIIDTVLGFLLGVGLSAIIQFFYGSSQGSRAKQEQLNALSEKLSAPAVQTGGS